MDQADTTTAEHYDYKSRAFIKNLDSEIKEDFLLSHLKQAGKVLAIKYHVDPVTSKPNGEAFVAYETQQEAEKAIELLNGKVLLKNTITVQHYHVPVETKSKGGATIYFRSFTRKIQLKNEEIAPFQYAWILQIKEYFKNQNIDVASAIVVYNQQAQQPFANIHFTNEKDAKQVYEQCEKDRSHDCLKGSAKSVWELLQKVGPEKLDGKPLYDLNVIKPFFESQMKSADDVFKSEQTNLYYSFKDSNKRGVDKRLLLALNVRTDVNEEQVLKFFSAYGKVLSVSLKNNYTNGKRQAFIQLQTEQDAINTLSKVAEDENSGSSNLFHIFNGPCCLTIVVPKEIRAEYQMIKKKKSLSRLVETQPAVQPVQQSYSQPVAYYQQQQQQYQQPNYDPNYQYQYYGYQQSYNQWQYPQQGYQPQSYNQGQGYNQGGYNQGGYNQGGYQRGHYQNRQGGYHQNNNNGYQSRNQGSYNNRNFQQQPQQPNQYQNVQQFPPFSNPIDTQVNPAPVYNKPKPVAKPQTVSFTSLETIKQNQKEFSALPDEQQRTNLGMILIKQVLRSLQTEHEIQNPQKTAQKITGMLINKETFEIDEILEMLESATELKERIEEGLQLIKAEEQEAQ